MNMDENGFILVSEAFFHSIYPAHLDGTEAVGQHLER